MNEEVTQCNADGQDHPDVFPPSRCTVYRSNESPPKIRSAETIHCRSQTKKERGGGGGGGYNKKKKKRGKKMGTMRGGRQNGKGTGPRPKASGDAWR